nr:MAG TPA: hypothetical protein [Caudoviricetes sp.]
MPNGNRVRSIFATNSHQWRTGRSLSTNTTSPESMRY